MNIVVRDYRDPDSDACRSLWGELAQHYAKIYEDPSIAGDDPGRGFEPYMSNAERKGNWVAEVDGQVVACAGLIVYGEEAEVEPVIVSSAYRGRGIGTVLVRHAASEAKRLQVRFLTIRPGARNEGAFRLFAKLGFDILGHIELLQDLTQTSDRTWRPGVTVHGIELRY